RGSPCRGRKYPTSRCASNPSARLCARGARGRKACLRVAATALYECEWGARPGAPRGTSTGCPCSSARFCVPGWPGSGRRAGGSCRRAR
nr:hypothetical protein [Tanacetum cinerariifolium]